MGIRTGARIRIVGKASKPIAQDSAAARRRDLDMVMENFRPDWLPDDLIDFHNLPEDFAPYLELGRNLFDRGIDFRRKLKYRKNSDGIIEGMVPDELHRRLGLLVFKNQDYRSHSTIIELRGEEDSPYYPHIHFRGEKDIDVDFQMRRIGDPQSTRSAMGVHVNKDGRLGLVGDDKQGLLFFNALFYMLERSLEKWEPPARAGR